MSEDRYLLNSLVRACKYQNNSVIFHKPIQKPLLNRLLKEIDARYDNADSNPQPYLASLYKAIFVAGYYGLLRIREVVKGTHPVLVRGVQIGQNKDKVLFELKTSKSHWHDDPPQTVKIQSTNCVSKTDFKRDPQVNTYCPYRILRKYSRLRPKYKSEWEQFFIYRDRSPVTATNINKVLKSLLTACDYSAEHFSFHSFRSGRGVDLL